MSRGVPSPVPQWPHGANLGNRPRPTGGISPCSCPGAPGPSPQRGGVKGLNIVIGSSHMLAAIISGYCQLCKRVSGHNQRLLLVVQTC